MSETMKVFVACALGAFIGTLVALEINGYFWWLGLFSGAIIVYLAYDFKEIAAAVPTAWRKARGWEPDREWWRWYLINWPMLYITVGFPFFVVCGVAYFFGPNGRITEAIIIMTGGSFFFGLILAFIIGPCTDSPEFPPNPLKIYFWILPKWTLKGIWWLLRKTPAFIGVTAITLAQVSIVVVRFVAYLFWEIHSDIRMLCGVDAAIGTAIGYFAGSAVIGAMAGGLWGALNFEILSIRVLKLVPIEKSFFRRF